MKTAQRPKRSEDRRSLFEFGGCGDYHAWQRTEWAKMRNARQWRHHLGKVCGGLAAKAPEDGETEFVSNSLSDR